MTLVAAYVVLFLGVFAIVGGLLRNGAPETADDWCDHEPHSRYVGHVAVDMNCGGRWADGVAPAYRCDNCLSEWTGAAEELRRPLADIVTMRRLAR